MKKPGRKLKSSNVILPTLNVGGRLVRCWLAIDSAKSASFVASLAPVSPGVLEAQGPYAESAVVGSCLVSSSWAGLHKDVAQALAAPKPTAERLVILSRFVRARAFTWVPRCGLAFLTSGAWRARWLITSRFLLKP